MIAPQIGHVASVESFSFAGHCRLYLPSLDHRAATLIFKHAVNTHLKQVQNELIYLTDVFVDYLGFEAPLPRLFYLSRLDACVNIFYYFCALLFLDVHRALRFRATDEGREQEQKIGKCETIFGECTSLFSS